MRILFVILIGEDALKSSTMQVQLHHIGGREGPNRQSCKEEFVDDVVSSRSDRSSPARGRMGGHNDAARWAGSSHLKTRKIEEGTLRPAFWMGDLRIRGGEQAGLNDWQIKQMIVLAPHDIGESGQIYHDRPIAILAIQTHHGLAQWNLLRFHIGTDRLQGPQQLSTVIAVACPRERSQPLMRVGLQERGACAHHFAPLAAQMARSADLA
jgi:hypothetical protein